MTSPSLGHLNDDNIAIPLTQQPILFPNFGGVGLATTVEMCSNGYINLLGTTTALGNPAVTAWLTGTAVRMGNHFN